MTLSPTKKYEVPLMNPKTAAIQNININKNPVNFSLVVSFLLIESIIYLENKLKIKYYPERYGRSTKLIEVIKRPKLPEKSNHLCLRVYPINLHNGE